MNTMCKALILIGPWICGCLPACGQDNNQEAPFEIQVLLKKHQERLDEGTIKLSKMTIAQLEKVQADYLRADRVDDALLAAKSIKTLQHEIERIQESHNVAGDIERSGRKTNSLRAGITTGKWIRAGKRQGIGRSIYTLKADGSAEGFVLNASNQQGAKTSWTSWELRGKDLQLGTESFRYDDETGTFVGSLSDLKKQEAGHE